MLQSVNLSTGGISSWFSLSTYLQQKMCSRFPRCGYRSRYIWGIINEWKTVCNSLTEDCFWQLHDVFFLIRLNLTSSCTSLIQLSWLSLALEVYYSVTLWYFSPLEYLSAMECVLKHCSITTNLTAVILLLIKWKTSNKNGEWS